MRVLMITAAVFLSSISLAAQDKPQWIRVNTFADSIVEANASDVAMIGDNMGRVTFLQTYHKAQRTTDDPRVRYFKELDLFEFDCSAPRYRPHAVYYLDQKDQVVRYDGSDGRREWKPVSSGSMADQYRLFGCRLIAQAARPAALQSAHPDVELVNAVMLAAQFWKQLKVAGNLRPLIRQFFVPDYLERIRDDPSENWFAKLTPETVVKLSRADLERYYLAVLDNEYLSSRYVRELEGSPGVSQKRPGEVTVSPEIQEAVAADPYTVKYQTTAGDYGYLGEEINDIGRARLYTALLERINAVLRRKKYDAQAARYDASDQRFATPDDRANEPEPEVRVCARECLGLPAGTRLYVFDLPIFRIQVAKIDEQMMVVSALYSEPDD